MNFLFVDRILDFVPGKSITGLKHVTLNDNYLLHNVDQKYSLLHSVIGEALGQLCSWYVLKSTDFTLRLVGGVIEDIQMFGDAYLGDTIYLENEIAELDVENRYVRVNARASVNGKTIILFKNGIAPLLPAEEFTDPEESKKVFARLYRPGVYDPHPKQDLEDSLNLKSQENPHSSDNYQDLNSYRYPETLPTPKLFPFVYDKILSWKPGQELLAKKNVSISAPYFVDHFPRKPLYPLSIMIEQNLQLSYAFFGKDPDIAVPAGQILRPVAVRKIKIGNFVQPGDSVVTRITLKEKNERGLILNFHNTVDNKKVCVAEAEFAVR